MIYFGVLVGLGIMAATVYLAISKKSNTATRIASLIALGVMILTIIICLFIVLMDNRVPVDESILIVGAPVEVNNESGGSNIIILLLLIIFLLIIFGVIIVVSLRENRENQKRLSKSSLLDESKPISRW